MIWIITIVDLLIFIVIALMVIYLLIFAIASFKYKSLKYPDSNHLHRFLVLFPAYKEDRVIYHSVTNFLKQNYPKDKFKVVVISDKMQDDTNAKLEELPILLLKVDFENSTKAKALKFALQYCPEETYDGVVILDADNIVEDNFLNNINNAYTGDKAIQTHRTAKNINTDTAILDCISEEINNSIFRAGHNRLGLSSALIGSGMVFNYRWFRSIIPHIFSAGEDKEIESMLLIQQIPIEYLEYVYVYDEKIQRQEAFKQQRLRWMAAQFDSFKRMCKQLPKAVRDRNINFCDKVLQMIMLPRVIILLLIVMFSITTTVFSLDMCLKWWILLLLFSLTILVAIPTSLINRKLIKAMWRIPALSWIMLLNLFHLKKGGKQFIHTNHGENSSI